MTGVSIEFPVGAVAIFAAALAVVLTTGCALVLRRRGQLTVRRLVVLGLASCYLAGVAALTVPMQIQTGDHANLIPWYEKASLLPLITIDPKTFVLNVVMTFPLGVLLPFLDRVRSVGQVALAGLALSATVEVLQFLSNVFVSSGRTADVNDLLANTLGAVLGYLTIRRLTRVPALATLAERWGAHPTAHPAPHPA